MKLKKCFVSLVAVVLNSIVFAIPAVSPDDKGQVFTSERASNILTTVRSMVSVPTPKEALLYHADLTKVLDEMAEDLLKQQFKKNEVTDEDSDQFIKTVRRQEIETQFRNGKISELTCQQRLWALERSSFKKEDLKFTVRRNILNQLMNVYIDKKWMSAEDAERGLEIFDFFEEIMAEATEEEAKEDTED